MFQQVGDAAQQRHHEGDFQAGGSLWGGGEGEIADNGLEMANGMGIGAE